VFLTSSTIDHFFIDRLHHASLGPGAADMDLKDRIERIADEMRGKERVTYRAIRKVMEGQPGGACSNSTLKPIFDQWKLDTGYKQKIESDPDLSPTVQKSLIALGHAILKEGEEKAQAKLAEQRRLLDRQAEIMLATDSEIAMAADRMEAEIVRLEAEIVRLHEALARAQVAGPSQASKPNESPREMNAIVALSTDASEADARHADIQGFFDAFGEAVHTLLETHGRLDGARIDFLLPKRISELARAVDMPLSPGWIRFWLRTFTSPEGPLLENEAGFILASQAAACVPEREAAFWAKVVDEIDAVLRARQAPLTPKAIIEQLPSALRREARWYEPLDPSRLAQMMEAEATRFRKVGKTRFASRADAA